MPRHRFVAATTLIWAESLESEYLRSSGPPSSIAQSGEAAQIRTGVTGHWPGTVILCYEVGLPRPYSIPISHSLVLCSWVGSLCHPL